MVRHGGTGDEEISCRNFIGGTSYGKHSCLWSTGYGNIPGSRLQCRRDGTFPNGGSLKRRECSAGNSRYFPGGKLRGRSKREYRRDNGSVRGGTGQPGTGGRTGSYRRTGDHRDPGGRSGDYGNTGRGRPTGTGI